MIDLYCERTTAGLWAEPANVTSNVAFLIAAVALWRLGRDPRASRRDATLLAVLTGAIAVGSTLFHLLATTWARPLDEGPIVLFQLTFLWLYGRRVLGLRAAAIAGVMAGLVLTSYAARQFTAALNGSLPYFPALLLTMAMGVEHARANRRDRWTLLVGSSVFGLAVILRSIDNAVCASFPVGTHFAWHLLAATTLYLFARGLAMNAGLGPTRRGGESR